MRAKQLKVYFDDEVLLDINFEVKNSLALVGESGSGKSLTLKALLDVVPSSMRVVKEIENEIKRGNDLAFVPQNPFTALSPLTKIKEQFFVEKSKVEEIFSLVGLSKSLLNRFPPELSGGQLQRVVLAIALSSSPKLLLLDEPTTALDYKTRETVIALLRELQKKLGFKMIFVTHDMQSASRLCDEIAVLYKGKIVESGRMETVIKAPIHEYTKELLNSNFSNREYRI